MGASITAFAVDCAGLRDWLPRAVGEVLFHFAEHARNEQFFCVYAVPDFRCRYHGSRKDGVFRMDHGVRSAVAREDVPRVPVLAQPLGEYLRATSGYLLKFFFESMSTCPGVTWVRELTDFRPWLLFSLLDGTRRANLPPTGLLELEQLVARMLRSHASDFRVYPLAVHSASPASESLPVLPAEDPDCEMAVFSPSDYQRWLALTDGLAACCEQFRAFWGEGHDVKTDLYVRSILGALASMRDMDMAEPRLVTFIG